MRAYGIMVRNTVYDYTRVFDLIMAKDYVDACIKARGLKYPKNFEFAGIR